MRAELVGLAVTVPALVVFLPGGGGVAAALISLVAYSVRLALLLGSALRVFGGTWWSFLLPTRADTQWIAGRLRQRRLGSAGR
jgi:hypothetical protein